MVDENRLKGRSNVEINIEENNDYEIDISGSLL